MGRESSSIDNFVKLVKGHHDTEINNSTRVCFAERFIIGKKKFACVLTWIGTGIKV